MDLSSSSAQSRHLGWMAAMSSSGRCASNTLGRSMFVAGRVRPSVGPLGSNDSIKEDCLYDRLSWVVVEAQE